MPLKRRLFGDYVEARDRGIDAKEGLAGADYKGDYAYPPDHPDYRNGVKPLPYKADKENEDQPGTLWVADSGEKDSKTLADEMTKGMDKATALGKPAKTQATKPKKAKMTNEEFALMSAKMSPAQLLDRSKSERDDFPVQKINDLFGNEFTPEPNQTIAYIASIMANSPRMIDRFVSECKNQGCLDSIVEGIMEHNSCYDSMANNFADPVKGKGRSGQLARALHDHYTKALDSVSIVENVGPRVEEIFGPNQQGGMQGGGTSKPKLGGGLLGNSESGPKPSADSSSSIFGGPKSSGGGMTPANVPSPSDASSGATAGAKSMGMPSPPANPDGNAMKPPSMPRKQMKAETAAGNVFGASAKLAPLKELMEGACKNGMC